MLLSPPLAQPREADYRATGAKREARFLSRILVRKMATARILNDREQLLSAIAAKTQRGIIGSELPLRQEERHRGFNKNK